MRRDPNDYATASAQQVGGVARRILSVLSQEVGQHYPDLPPGVLKRFLEQLQAGIMQPGVDASDRILNLMRRSGIRDADIADYYIPVIARRLGEAWVNDQLDFAAVTAGSGQLQDMLRRLDASWTTPADMAIGLRGDYCVIVPEDEQHTLGAQILTGQLRRAGCDVQLKTGLPLSAVVETVARNEFRGVFISASIRQRLDFLREVVTKARHGCGAAPLLIGGSILDKGPEVDRMIGADLATNDWETALGFCEERGQR